MRMTPRKFGIMTACIVVAREDARNGVMAMTTNLERFGAIIERGFSRGDLAVADEVCAEKLIEHEYLSKTDIPGPQILKAQIEGARHSIKDLVLTMEAVVETNDTVAQQGYGRRSALRQAGGHRCHRHLSVRRWKACGTLGGAGPIRPSSPDWSAPAPAQTGVDRRCLFAQKPSRARKLGRSRNAENARHFLWCWAGALIAPCR